MSSGEELEIITKGKLRRMFAAMRRAMPAIRDIPISVTIDSSLKNSFGLATREEDCYGEVVYTISIIPGVQVITAEELLIHELAHVIHWEEGGDEQHHGSEWGKIYASVYRMWTGES